MVQKIHKFEDLPLQDKAQVLFQRAVKHHQGGKLEEALSLYTQAVAYWPDFPDAFNNMAVALRKLKRYDAALACYQRSLSVRPDHAATYSNMGNVLNDMDRVDEAIEAHLKAIALDEGNLLHLYNAALVMRDAGRSGEAIDMFDQVLAVDEHYKDCHWDRALTYLMNGDFKRGFADYDARWSLAKSPPRTFSKPRWQGEALAGRTLFIHREQGFGDAIQFARLLPGLKARFGAGKVVVECQPDLLNLLGDMDGVDEFVPAGEGGIPEFDVWIPLMSLAHILELDENNIPGTVPFLKAPINKALHLRPAPDQVLNIGVVWAGSPTHQNDRRRSAGIERFIPLARHKGVRVFSLQKGPRASDLKSSGADCLFVDAAQKINDFSDTACLISQMDLIITVDTSVAHLAGALGKDVWVVLPYTPDWRWMWQREDSPWYPTMRLFRQDRPGDWENCFSKVYSALAQRLP